MTVTTLWDPEVKALLDNATLLAQMYKRLGAIPLGQPGMPYSTRKVPPYACHSL